jgi:L-histidine N-alpha-methyltransferase
LASSLLTAFFETPTPLLLVELGTEANSFKEEIAAGLSTPGRRSIPCAYLYDQQGALLYEEITRTPEYYPARTETSILQKIAPMLRERLGAVRLIELGSGASVKTRLLLDAWRAKEEEVLYIPIDVSRAMLAQSAASLVADYQGLRILGLIGRYEEALAALPTSRGSLVCFLGGTIGNFEPQEQSLFFQKIAQRMHPGDHLLLGFSRQPHPKKSIQMIREAYDDASGVTAQFSLNLLARINRELNANFVLAQFAHVAVYNESKQQIEIYIESLIAQEVRIEELGRSYFFSKGERIFTEISRRYDPQELAHWFEARGFSCQEHFSDEVGLFGLLLLQYKGS